MVKKLAPLHPGEILQTEFLEPLNLSQTKLALALRVPATRIHEIIHGKRSISAETAMRLARYFGTSAQFWLNLQARFDLEAAEDQNGAMVQREVLPREPART